MFLWAHTDTHRVKSDVRRGVHSSAVPSSPCEIYNHISFGEFGRLQKKAYFPPQKLSLINFTNAKSIL